MWKIVCILVVYIALYYGSQSNEFDSGNSRSTPFDEIADLMKRSGLLMYKIHRYDINVDETLADYAKGVIRSGESVAARSVSSRDVDSVFALLDKQAMKNMSVYVIEFTAKGRQLFTPNSSWKWMSNGKELGFPSENFQGVKKSPRPVLVSEADGFSFEFVLGPQFSQAENIGKTFITKYHLQKGIQYALSGPSVRSKLKGRNQMFEYSIFLHPTAENSLYLVPKNSREEKIAKKAYLLMHAITEKMVKNIDELNPEKDLGVDYFYNAEAAMIKFNDENLYNFIRRWVRPTGPKHVEVNLYGIVKEFLKNPEALSKYIKKTNIPHDYHEMEVPGFGDRVLYIDKFPDSTKFIGKMFKTNFKPNDAPSRFMIDSLKARAQQMADRVEEKGLIDSDLNSWQKWYENIVQEDFEKHRKMTGATHGLPFLESDRHLTARRKDDFKPSEREFGPPYGIAVELNNRNIPMAAQRRDWDNIRF